MTVRVYFSFRCFLFVVVVVVAVVVVVVVVCFLCLQFLSVCLFFFQAAS